MGDKYTYLTPIERLNLDYADRDRGTVAAKTHTRQAIGEVSMRRYLVIDDFDGILGDTDILPDEEFNGHSFVDAETNKVLAFGGDSWFVNDWIKEYDPEKDYSLGGTVARWKEAVEEEVRT